MATFEDKNCLVCDSEYHSDEKLFRYYYVYNDSYSFLTAEIIFAIIKYTLLIILLLRGSGFFWEDSSLVKKPPKSEPVAAIVCDDFNSDFSRGRPKKTIIYDTGFAASTLWPDRLSKPVQSNVTYTVGPKFVVDVPLKATFRVPHFRHVPCYSFNEHRFEFPTVEEKDASYESLAKAGKLIVNPSKRIIEQPNLLENAEKEYKEKFGQNISTKDQKFYNYFNNYVLKYMKKRQVKGVTINGIKYSESQVRQYLASDIALWQVMPLDRVDKIEDAMTMARVNMTKYKQGVISRADFEQNRSEIQTKLRSVNSTDIPILQFFNQATQDRAAYIYAHKRATNNYYPNSYAEWGPVYELQDCHVCSNKAGGPAILVNLGTMSDANHAIITEIEFLIDPSTAPGDGGLDILSKILERNRGFINIQASVSKNILSQMAIRRTFEPIQKAIVELPWATDTPQAVNTCMDILNSCVNFKNTNPEFMQINGIVMEGVATILGQHVGGSYAAYIAKEWGQNAMTVAFCHRVGSYAGADIMVTSVFQAYQNNLKMAAGSITDSFASLSSYQTGSSFLIEVLQKIPLGKLFSFYVFNLISVYIFLFILNSCFLLSLSNIYFFSPVASKIFLFLIKKFIF